MLTLAVFTKMALIYFGAFLLVLSLIPIRRLVSSLPSGKLKNKWNILSSLIVVFIIGYVYYGASYWITHQNSENYDLLVPFIFFAGGIFVLLVGRLAFQTAKDMRKIAILEFKSVTDSLLNIKNRRYFEQVIQDEINLSKRYLIPLSLLMIDIDKFKNINDTYGHLSGDEVLKNTAKAIKNIARDSDIICRYGGEEIAVITPNTSQEQALILAQRLRNAIENSVMAISCASQEEINITVSIGVSSLDNKSVKTKEALIKKADNALYEAKQSGRNRVCSL